MQKHKFSGGAAESPGETQTLNERVRKSRENVRKINENAPELVHKSAYGIRKELLKWQICAERRRTTAHRPHFCPPPFRHPPAPWIFPWFSSLLTTTTCQCQHILGHSSGQPQGSWRRHIGFLLCLSLSLSLLAKNIFMAATHKSQKVPNVICLPFLFAFFHAVYFCLGAINPFLLLFRLWDNKLLWQKAFNGLATKFRNFFAICRHHNNLRLINQKFSLPQKRLEMNLMNIGRWRENQIVVESFWLAIKLILMSSDRVCQFLGNTLRFGSRN